MATLRGVVQRGVGLERKKTQTNLFLLLSGKKENKEKNTQSPPEWGFPYLNSFEYK